MRKLNDLFQELGISKVRLAKYLGVSRQMVYNYLELNDINKWPKEKKLLLFKLLDVSDAKEIDDIKPVVKYCTMDQELKMDTISKIKEAMSNLVYNNL